MKAYIQEQTDMNGLNSSIHQFLKSNKFQFGNISTALFSIENIMSTKGYRLANPDGTHHREVYTGDKGNADISIVNGVGDISTKVAKLNWKLMDTGLGWKIDLRII